MNTTETQPACPPQMNPQQRAVSIRVALIVRADELEARAKSLRALAGQVPSKMTDEIERLWNVAVWGGKL